MTNKEFAKQIPDQVKNQFCHQLNLNLKIWMKWYKTFITENEHNLPALLNPNLTWLEKNDLTYKNFDLPKRRGWKINETAGKDALTYLHNSSAAQKN